MPGSGIHITQSQVTGFGAAMYVAGAPAVTCDSRPAVLNALPG
jgi:hypothetical protein